MQRVICSPEMYMQKQSVRTRFFGIDIDRRKQLTIYFKQKLQM